MQSRIRSAAWLFCDMKNVVMTHEHSFTIGIASIFFVAFGPLIDRLKKAAPMHDRRFPTSPS